MASGTSRHTGAKREGDSKPMAHTATASRHAGVHKRKGHRKGTAFPDLWKASLFLAETTQRISCRNTEARETAKSACTTCVRCCCCCKPLNREHSSAMSAAPRSTGEEKSCVKRARAPQMVEKRSNIKAKTREPTTSFTVVCGIFRANIPLVLSLQEFNWRQVLPSLQEKSCCNKYYRLQSRCGGGNFKFNNFEVQSLQLPKTSCSVLDKHFYNEARCAAGWRGPNSGCFSPVDSPPSPPQSCANRVPD
jgi:hypothetical protein